LYQTEERAESGVGLGDFAQAAQESRLCRIDFERLGAGQLESCSAAGHFVSMNCFAQVVALSTEKTIRN